MDLVTIIENAIPLLSQYGILISFLGGFFAGEEVIATLSFLSTQGYISIWVVFIFCFIGILLCDLFFFSIGKFKLFSSFKKFERIMKISKKVDKIVSRLSKESPIRALLYTKFIFGTRIATLIYLGIKDITYKKFIKSDFIVGILWMSIVVSIGWFAGSSFRLIIKILGNIQIALGFLVLFIVIIFIIFKILQNILLARIKLNGKNE